MKCGRWHILFILICIKLALLQNVIINGEMAKNSFHLYVKSAICFQIKLPKWPKLENMIPPTPIGRKRRLQRNLLNESYMNIYLLNIYNINVSLLWPIMKAAVHFIIHVNGQQRVGTHSGQVVLFMNTTWWYFHLVNKIKCQQQSQTIAL